VINAYETGLGLSVVIGRYPTAGCVPQIGVVVPPSSRPAVRHAHGAQRDLRQVPEDWSYPYTVWLPDASYFTGGIGFHKSPDVLAFPAPRLRSCAARRRPARRLIRDARAAR